MDQATPGLDTAKVTVEVMVERITTEMQSTGVR